MTHELADATEPFDLDRLDGRVGEGWGGDGVLGCHINLVLAANGSPTGAAAALALASPAPGHVPFLVCAGGGTLVRPATVVVNKTTLTNAALEQLTWGALQLGIAQAVLDAVAAGIVPVELTGEITLLVAAWIDPAAGARPVDAEAETALRLAARTAMLAAITDARWPAPPGAQQSLIARRDTISNGFYQGR